VKKHSERQTWYAYRIYICVNQLVWYISGSHFTVRSSDILPHRRGVGHWGWETRISWTYKLQGPPWLSACDTLQAEIFAIKN